MACMGCGGEVSTAGCINSDCAYSVGGTYLNGKKMSKAVAVKNVVWLGGQEWATCRTPGQAARVAEDMNAVYTLELRMSNAILGIPAEESY